MITAVVHGRPCRHGHGTPRYASNNRCPECASLYQKQHRTVQNKAHKKWRSANPEKVAVKNKRYYQAHSKEAKIKSRERYWANPEKVRAQVLQRIRDNSEKDAAKTAFRRAYKLKATPKWLTREHKAAIMKFYRRAKELGLVVDHIVPLRGEAVCGLHVPWNLQLLSLSENSSKGNSWVA